MSKPYFCFGIKVEFKPEINSNLLLKNIQIQQKSFITIIRKPSDLEATITLLNVNALWKGLPSIITFVFADL